MKFSNAVKLADDKCIIDLWVSQYRFLDSVKSARLQRNGQRDMNAIMREVDKRNLRESLPTIWSK